MDRRHWAIVGAFALLRVWMMAAMPFTAVPARHDDLLFLNQAAALADGRWLGSYDDLTLAKGPFYPMFVAASYAARTPLRLSQELLYVGFCFVSLLALRPLRLGGPLLSVVGALLLLAPLTTSAVVAARVIREGVYTALAGLSVSAALGLFLRRGAPARVLAVWAVGLGAAAAAAWLTREEGAWLLLPLGLLVGAAAWAQRRDGASRLRRILVVVALPVLVAGAAWTSVAATNAWRYGWFTVVEWKTGAFRSAYGALLRAGGGDRRWVPVPRGARQLLYERSPSFASLRPYLEGQPGRGYAAASCEALPVSCGDVGGGWFIWLFREAVARDGHYASAARARSFYRDLAVEIDGLCASGTVECTRARRSVVPPFGWHLTPDLLGAAARGAWRLVRSDGFIAEPWPSTGPQRVRERYARITRSAIAEAPAGSAGGHAPPSVQSRLRGSLAAAYGWLGPLLVAAALAGTLRECRRAAKDRELAFLVVLVALGLAVLARLLLLASVDVTSFRAMHPRLLAVAQPPLLLFSVLGAARLSRLHGLRGSGPGRSGREGRSGQPPGRPATA